MTALPNPFLNSVTPPPPAVTDTAGVSPCPPDAPAGTIHEPSTTNGGDQEAIAGSAPPNTATPAGALDSRIDWRAFWDFITDERIVLFEPFVEHPMFIIEDGSLQRHEA